VIRPLKMLMVTGASGFLGASIVRLAREAGWQVRSVVRSPGPQIEGVETFVADIGDLERLRKASAGVTAIIHAAGLAHVPVPRAEDVARFSQANEAGTDNVVQAAVECGVPQVVLVSSVSVYGGYDGALCDETAPCHPIGPYAISKWRGELRACARMAQGQASLTILRFATMYGEGDRGNVARLIGALDRGRFVWPGPGQNRKCLIYKEDAARACLGALERRAAGAEIFNVSPRSATMREIVIAICQALGRSAPRLEIPLSVIQAAGAMSSRMGDPGHLAQRMQKFIRDDVYDGSKFESTFDFRPAVSLAEGMRREVDSLRSERRK